MTKTEKTNVIEELRETFEQNKFFYLTDSSAMTVGDVNVLRRKCFEQGVSMKVVKNTLARKALETFPEEAGYEGLFDSLKGPTTLMYCETANVPAKLIKEFRKSSEKPVLKAAYIDSSVFVGDDQLDALSNLKSKEDLIGDVLLILQSPIKNVLGSLQSGGNTISGLLKALEERAES
ncbi:MAG: 50S ribosomal protein L10 [Bacteroidota bacterium]